MTYPDLVMTRVRQNLGLEPDDPSEDARIIGMNRTEIFDRCLNWEGIINFGGLIRHLAEQIFEVKLRN